MSQKLQIGKYEFYPYEFSLDDNLDELFREKELLSLSQKERDKRLKEIFRKLAEISRNNSKKSRKRLLDEILH